MKSMTIEGLRDELRALHGRGLPGRSRSQGGMIVAATWFQRRNPDPTAEQITLDMNGHLCRGGTSFGTSRALKEEVTFDRSNVSSVDVATYPIFRITEVPKIIVDIDNRLEVPSRSTGETPNITPRAAGRVRLRKQPYSHERAKAALAATGSRAQAAHA